MSQVTFGHVLRQEIKNAFDFFTFYNYYFISILALEKELRDHMYLSMIGSGVGGALFIFTIIILGVMTKMCQWRKSRKKARF